MPKQPQQRDCGSVIYIDGIPANTQIDLVGQGFQLVSVIRQEKHHFQAIQKCEAYCKRHDLPAYQIMVIDAHLTGLGFDDFVAVHLQKLAQEMDAYRTHEVLTDLWH